MNFVYLCLLQDRDNKDRIITVVLYAPGQLSLLPAAGWKMSTGQSATTLCGWEVKARMVHSTCG